MIDATTLNYIKQAYQLESQLYTFQRMKDTLKRKKENIEISIHVETGKKSHLEYRIKNDSPWIVDKIQTGLGYLLMGLCCLWALFVLGIFLVGLEGLLYTIILTLIIIGLVFLSRMISHYTQKHNSSKLGKNIEQQQINIENLKNQVASLDAMDKEINPLISEKQNVLNKMYACGIIHPNYRNFYCISKIYELLDTGICDSLHGVNGAYSQLRMDQIIDNQKLMISNQQKLLASNYMLYDSMCKTNALVAQVVHKLDKNTQNLSKISDQLEMQRFLSESNATNINALRESTEYLKFAERQNRMYQGYYN